MNLLVTELSKYFMIGFMALYVVESIWPMFVHEGDKNRGVYVRQYIYVLVVHTLGMVSMYIQFQDPKFLFLYFVQLVGLFVVNRISCLLYDSLSRMLLNHMCMLLSVGFIMLARLNFDKAIRQSLIIAVSLAVFVLIPIIIKKWDFIKNYTVLYGTIGLSAIVLVLSVGSAVNGSKLSFQLLGFTFQPSEFVKILFVFFIAGMLHEHNDFKRVVLTSIFAAMFVSVLALSTDLGSALIFYLAYIVILFVATGKLIYSILGLIGGGAAAYFGFLTFTHVQTRIATWLDPWSDPNGKGYQLTQSLFAIGTGDWWGRGLGKGQPTTIPYVEEDFVFSAICEEMGVIFALLVLTLCLCTFVLFTKIALRTVDRYYKLVVIGIASIYSAQVMLTVGGGTRFIPLTGVTLPLISNGGSSAMSTILMFAIVAGVSLFDNEAEEEEVELLSKSEFVALSDEEKAEYKKSIRNQRKEQEKEQKLDRKKKFSAILICSVNALLFIGIAINIGKYMYLERDEAVTNSFNIKRQESIASETVRGSIYASDGTLLAYTSVDAQGNENRIYPQGDLYAHAVGYSTYGKTGIENSMNMSLITTSLGLSDRVSYDMNGQKAPGDSVITTLDPVLQQVAYDCLGVYKGAIIVTEASTGRVLAMVSKPTFDPNSVSMNFAEISEDTVSAPLLNRVSQGLYPPGSTFKIVTALEYMRENPDTFDNYHYNCNGYFAIGQDRINCFHGSVHGYVDFRRSLAKSCNSSFANIGMMLDRNKFIETLYGLGFNESLPVAFEASPSHISIREDMSNEAIMQTAIGQSETLMTPMHLNMITGAIANGGIMMNPYLVDRVEDVNGHIIKTYNPSEYGRVMTGEETAVLTDMMIAVIEEGTATKLSGQMYTCAGKTGSAEYGDVKGQSHAWFTGFAPAENPEIVVTVIIEGGGTGGDYCAPIARRIFSAYFMK